MRVQRFEDLRTWQEARELRRAVLKAIRTHQFGRELELADQMRRAALSVMANIAEGFGRAGPREFHRFLSTANGSCNELRSHLHAALDSGILDPSQANELIDHATKVASLIGALRASIQRRLQPPTPPSP